MTYLTEPNFYNLGDMMVIYGGSYQLKHSVCDIDIFFDLFVSIFLSESFSNLVFVLHFSDLFFCVFWYLLYQVGFSNVLEGYLIFTLDVGFCPTFFPFCLIYIIYIVLLLSFLLVLLFWLIFNEFFIIC